MFLILLHALVRKNNWVLIRRTTMAILLISMIWSGTMGILYDYMYHREQRHFNLKQATLASTFISDNAIVFTDQVDTFAHLMESHRVRIANPFNDKFRIFTN
ncbi:MAG: hypothetical protein U5K27_13725 [Desulfotignum sp.]|nr:hypothetical protein [Desulfotignum sp.]